MYLQIELGTVPLPKSSNPKRIEENFNVFDFKLDAEDHALLEISGHSVFNRVRVKMTGKTGYLKHNDGTQIQPIGLGTFAVRL